MSERQHSIPGRATQEAVGSLNWPRAIGWASYDFANTIYSAVIVSFAIALHAREFTGEEKYAFLTASLSLLASGLFVPFAGALADRTGKAKRYLAVFTVVCCVSCASITWASRAALILVLYFVANFCYNSSLVFYDSLLPVVAPRKNFGLVSGIGVGLGYGGVAVALPIAMLALHFYRRLEPEHELAPMFVLAGALFLLCSVPLFLFVPERRLSKPPPPRGELLRLTFTRTMVTIRALPRHKNMLLFLLGNFFCVDALNATIFAYAPYVENVFGMDRQWVMFWMIPFALTALGLGVLGGRLSDRIGSRKAMISAAVSFMLAVIICSLCVNPYVFFPAFIVLGGYGLSTIWTAGRKMLLSLAPPGQTGKYFGFYNVGHKLSMVGIALFGIIADIDVPGVHAGGYRAGLLLQVVAMAVGVILIYKVKVNDATG